MKKILFFLLATCSLAFTANLPANVIPRLATCLETPEPYHSIGELPFDEQGWFENELILTPIMANKKPRIVIEVGSWLGSSTRFLANHINATGTVYAVDTWKGTPDEKREMHSSRLPYLYHQFLSNVKHAGLTDKIVPVRMESIEAAKALNVKADLIYIDGAHDSVSVAEDIINWYPHLYENGVICGNEWVRPSVREAVTQCATSLGQVTHVEGNFWWFEKP